MQYSSYLNYIKTGNTIVTSAVCRFEQFRYHECVCVCVCVCVVIYTCVCVCVSMCVSVYVWMSDDHILGFTVSLCLLRLFAVYYTCSALKIMARDPTTVPLQETCCCHSNHLRALTNGICQCYYKAVCYVMRQTSHQYQLLGRGDLDNTVSSGVQWGYAWVCFQAGGVTRPWNHYQIGACSVHKGKILGIGDFVSFSNEPSSSDLLTTSVVERFVLFCHK